MIEAGKGRCARAGRRACSIATAGAIGALVAACGGHGNDDGASTGSGTLPSGSTPPSVALRQAPRDTTSVAGESVRFTVSASGTAPLLYQWFRDGVAVPNAIGPFVDVPSPDARDAAAAYTVRVDAGGASVTSSPAHLTLGGAPGIRAVAGRFANTGSVQGPAVDAKFMGLGGIAIDAAGALVVTDGLDSRLMRIDPATGLVTTLIDRNALITDGGDVDGSVAVARTSSPAQIASTAVGDLYYVDTVGLRKIANDVQSTLATAAALCPSPATCAYGGSDGGVAVGIDGTVYVGVGGVVRKVTQAGVVSTLAGQAATGFADGSGAAAQFGTRLRLAVDAAGNVFVADATNHVVRRIAPSGAVVTIAGSATEAGTADGFGTAARLAAPVGIAFGPDGLLYLADQIAGTIRTLDPTTLRVITITGTPGAADADGMGAAGQIAAPTALVVDPAGNVYATQANAVRLVTPARAVVDFTGTRPAAACTTSGDGTRFAACFASDTHVAVDRSSGALFVADAYSVRHVTDDGVVATLAGSRSPSTSDVDGIGTAASFSSIRALRVDGPGTVWLTSAAGGGLLGGLLRTVAPDGTVTTVAPPPSLVPRNLRNLAFDAQGNLAIEDAFIICQPIHDFVNCFPSSGRIDRRSPANVWDVYAGGNSGGHDDGPRLSATFGGALSLVWVGDVLYVSDQVAASIRRIGSDGRVTTLALQPAATAACASAARAPSLFGPLVADSQGRLILADYDVVWRIASDGSVAIVAGSPCHDGVRFGALPGGLGRITDLAIDANDVLTVGQASGVVRFALPR